MRSPGPLLLLAYRLVGWRLGPEYGGWVHEDLSRPGWLVRQGAPAAGVLLLTAGLVGRLAGVNGGRLLALVVVLLAGGAFLRTSLRERAFHQQGIDLSGDPAAAWYADKRARRRRNVVGAVATPALVLAGLLLVAYRSHR